MAFCPNCGSQVADSAPACSKCNTPIAAAGGGAAAPGKFKGTIMMGGASAAEVEAMVAKAKAAAQASQARTGASAAAAAPASSAAPAARGGPSSDGLAYQATMMGPITPPVGTGSAEFPHPLAAGGAAVDPLHSAATVLPDEASGGLSGATVIDPNPPGSMGFSDERVSLPTTGGKSGFKIVIILVALLVLGAIGAVIFMYVRSQSAVPQYPYPGMPVPGQMPGQMPGQFPVPGPFPGVPGIPPPVPSPQ